MHESVTVFGIKNRRQEKRDWKKYTGSLLSECNHDTLCRSHFFLSLFSCLLSTIIKLKITFHSVLRLVKFAICTALCFLPLIACSKPNPPTEPAPNFFKVDSKTAGVISGKIIFSGKKTSHKIVNMDADPQCAKLHPSAVSDESIAVNATGMLANVFVYIKNGLEDKNFEPPANPVVIDQNGCWFNPRVLGIQVGQTLQVKNSDPVTHNIHPLPTVNREWNQSQAPESEPFTRKFTQPEVMIKVKCNIHAWMHAWVGAVAHPYFAVTGADGTFQLKNVPPGNYTIEIWHEELGKQEQQITLSPASASEVTFNFK